MDDGVPETIHFAVCTIEPDQFRRYRSMCGLSAWRIGWHTVELLPVERPKEEQ